LNFIEVEVLTWEISALHVEKMPSNLQTKSKIDKIMREEFPCAYLISNRSDLTKMFSKYFSPIQGVPELAPQRKKGALGRIY
jgi:hypothetical protein